MKIRPVWDRVLVKIIKTEEKTAGGVYIPQETRSREDMAQTEGEIIAIGELAFAELKDKPEIGDHVIFGRYSGLEIKENFALYRLVDEQDIAGIKETKDG